MVCAQLLSLRLAKLCWAAWAEGIHIYYQMDHDFVFDFLIAGLSTNWIIWICSNKIAWIDSQINNLLHLWKHWIICFFFWFYFSIITWVLPYVGSYAFNLDQHQHKHQHTPNIPMIFQSTRFSGIHGSLHKSYITFATRAAFYRIRELKNRTWCCLMFKPRIIHNFRLYRWLNKQNNNINNNVGVTEFLVLHLRMGAFEPCSKITGYDGANSIRLGAASASYIS